MKALIKSLVYTALSICIADTLATTPARMQAIIFFCLMLASTFELLKLANEESTN